MWIKEVRGEEKRKGQVREEKRKGPASQKVGMAAGLEGLHRGRGSGCDHPGEFHFNLGVPLLSRAVHHPAAICHDITCRAATLSKPKKPPLSNGTH